MALIFQAHSALLAEEEAIALSVWTVACICGCLRLENVSMNVGVSSPPFLEDCLQISYLASSILKWLNM